jgi:hypothetical protein
MDGLMYQFHMLALAFPVQVLGEMDPMVVHWPVMLF